MTDIERLRYLASPDAERMSDYQRLNEFVKFGHEAADEIERLRAELAGNEARINELGTALSKAYQFISPLSDPMPISNAEMAREIMAALESTATFYIHNPAEK